MVLLQSSMVPLGSPAHDFSLKGIDGRQHTLADYKGAKALVIIFMCNHCPYVQAMWDDLVTLSEDLTEAQFIGINSNANPNYPEDSFEKMAEHAKEREMEFPYLYDESQVVSKDYDAQCTPDIFLYDEKQKLVYRGAFASLRAAIEAVLIGDEIPEEQEHSMGCSIKWTE